MIRDVKKQRETLKDFAMEEAKATCRMVAVGAFAIGLTVGGVVVGLTMSERMEVMRLTFDSNVAKLTEREQLCIIEQGREVHKFPCKTEAQGVLKTQWIR